MREKGEIILMINLMDLKMGYKVLTIIVLIILVVGFVIEIIRKMHEYYKNTKNNSENKGFFSFMFGDIVKKVMKLPRLSVKLAIYSFSAMAIIIVTIVINPTLIKNMFADILSVEPEIIELDYNLTQDDINVISAEVTSKKSWLCIINCQSYTYEGGYEVVFPSVTTKSIDSVYINV